MAFSGPVSTGRRAEDAKAAPGSAPCSPRVKAPCPPPFLALAADLVPLLPLGPRSGSEPLWCLELRQPLCSRVPLQVLQLSLRRFLVFSFSWAHPYPHHGLFIVCLFVFLSLSLPVLALSLTSVELAVGVRWHVRGCRSLSPCSSLHLSLSLPLAPHL